MAGLDDAIDENTGAQRAFGGDGAFFEHTAVEVKAVAQGLADEDLGGGGVDGGGGELGG